MDDLELIRQRLKLPPLEAMPFDVSTRRYFRAPGRVLMLDQDEGHETRIANFVDIAERLRRADIHAPEIYEAAPSEGYVLMQDFGAHALKDDASDENLFAAFDNLKKFQNVDFDGLKLYSQAVYEEELSRLSKFYLQPLGVDDFEILDLARDVIEELSSASNFFVHLDYHQENILLLENGAQGLIDFQDARQGHRLYDLASFVDDVRNPLKDNLKAEFLANLNVTERRDLALLSAQRLMKIIGIFARMSAEGRKKYQALLFDVFAVLEARLLDENLRRWREWFYDVVPMPSAEVIAKLENQSDD